MGLIEMGLVVGIALLMTMSKMNWHCRLKVLSNPVLVDLMVFALLVVLHWGTFSGVMVATVGAAMISGILAMGRKVYGHYDKAGDYVPGLTNVSDKLIV
jgi:hypothetical protein